MNFFTQYYKTACITVEVISEYEITKTTFDEKFKPFRVSSPGNETVKVYHLFNSPAPEYEKFEKIFEDPYWRIFKSEEEWFYEYHPPASAKIKGTVVGQFNRDHSVTRIYAPHIHQKQYQTAGFPSLLLFNTDQMLFARLLNEKGGLILHANGFDVNSRGILLTGNSGSGKTTLSGMLKQCGAKILCDDRMFVRPVDGKLRLFGNWNHGSVPDTSAGTAPLNAIFFLEKSDNNQIIKIEDKQTISLDLFQSVVKQFLTRQEWQVSFTSLEKLIREIDCYCIKFNLDGSIGPKVVDLMKNYPKP